MKTSKNTLPKAPIEKIIKSASEKQGIKRVSKDAVDEMTEILERIGVNISRQAQGLAAHAKRTTIKSKDIELSHLK